VINGRKSYRSVRVSAVTISRRNFLGLAGAAAAATALPGCGGFSAGGGDDQQANPDTLKLTIWGEGPEVAAFKRVADAFKAKEKVTVTVNAVPFTEVRKSVDAGLQSGRAPDLFRITYNDIGIYGGQGVLLELDKFLPEGYAGGFNPALWQAVQAGGKVVGVPHHTDTSMILYNKQALASAGITSVPSTPDTAWTWDQFTGVARQLRAKLPSNKFPFGYNWQQFGAYRWLSWVFQADGRLLTDDLSGPAIDSAQGRKALQLTQSFFTDNLVPRTTSTKGKYIDELFPSGAVAMGFLGDFQLASLEQNVKNFEYGATFLPRDVRDAADLGGNAVVATKDTKNPEAAAKFLQFLADETNMADFCARTNVLPTRTSLVGKDLPFAARPDLMKLYVQQAQSIKPQDVAQVTVPKFGSINTVLVEQLERAFIGRADVGKVLADMSSGVEQALKK
jgi:multiple sugar transport system substrate-binding protein